MKDEWLKQKEVLKTQGLSIIWMYNYYIDNLEKSSIKIKLTFEEFQQYFQQFLQMLNIQIAFHETEYLKTMFSSGRSYYVSQENIVKQVIDHFNNKYK
jgi:hypothetical protein